MEWNGMEGGERLRINSSRAAYSDLRMLSVSAQPPLGSGHSLSVPGTDGAEMLTLLC